MNSSSKIYVAGHRGLVGSAIHRRLAADGYTNLVVKTSKELDLTRQAEVEAFFEKEKPEYVFLAAAKVGGILANNTYPADFIYRNIMIQTNVIHSSYRQGIKKLLFLGSSCIYPKYCPQPMKEEYLLTGDLEPTNEPYAVAKIAGIKMCQSYNRQHGTNYISVMPTNLYGPFDNFDLETSHVLPALIRRFHEAKIAQVPSVTIWGTGTSKREFLYIDDLADACVFLMDRYDGSEIVNIGVGEDISINDLALLVREVAGFQGGIAYDRSKPDGTPRKLLDVSRLHSLGWHAKTGLREGVRKTYDWYVKHSSLLGTSADTG
ncbi:MAG: GDP-L-fucose synthase [Nitrospiraceae bacterium]|nr:GDP-L-fucose synthase [Nitrospiraceae bacterium]